MSSETQSKHPETDAFEANLYIGVTSIGEHELKQAIEYAATLEQQRDEALRHNKAIINMDMLRENQSHIAQMAVMVGALKGCEVVLDVLYTFQRHNPVWIQFDGTGKRDAARTALANTPLAAKELLEQVERMERMEKALEAVIKIDDMSRIEWQKIGIIQPDYQITKKCRKALSTSTKPTE